MGRGALIPKHGFRWCKIAFLYHMSNTVEFIFWVIKHFLKSFQSLKKGFIPIYSMAYIFEDLNLDIIIIIQSIYNCINNLIWFTIFVFKGSSPGSFIYTRLNPHYRCDCISEGNM